MEKYIKLFYWLPRIIGIIAILFISLFALDAFDLPGTIWEKLGAFLIHLIPSFILTVILLIAWKRENIGGIIFIAIGLLFSPWVFTHNYKMNQSVWMSLGVIMLITMPFVVTGILFLVSHYLKKKKTEKDQN